MTASQRIQRTGHPRAIVGAIFVLGAILATPLRAAEKAAAEVSDALRERAYGEASRSFIESHAFCRSAFAYVAQCIGNREQEQSLDAASTALRTEAIEAARTIATREEGLYEKTGAAWPEFDAGRRKARAAAVGTDLPCSQFLETRRPQIDQCRELLARPGDRFQSAFDGAVVRLRRDGTESDARPADDAAAAQPAGKAAAAAGDKASTTSGKAPTPAGVKQETRRSIAAAPAQGAEIKPPPPRSKKLKRAAKKMGKTATGK